MKECKVVAGTRTRQSTAHRCPCALTIRFRRCCCGVCERSVGLQPKRKRVWKKKVESMRSQRFEVHAPCCTAAACIQTLRMWGARRPACFVATNVGRNRKGQNAHRVATRPLNTPAACRSEQTKRVETIASNNKREILKEKKKNGKGETSPLLSLLNRIAASTRRERRALRTAAFCASLMHCWYAPMCKAFLTSNSSSTLMIPPSLFCQSVVEPKKSISLSLSVTSQAPRVLSPSAPLL